MGLATRARILNSEQLRSTSVQLGYSSRSFGCGRATPARFAGRCCLLTGEGSWSYAVTSAPCRSVTGEKLFVLVGPSGVSEAETD